MRRWLHRGRLRLRHRFSVCRKSSAITKYISLVNLIAGREVVQELFGVRFSYDQIHDELGRVLNDHAYRRRMLDGYDEMIRLLGKPGASRRTAELIYQSLKH